MKPRILVVDDDAEFAQLMEFNLSRLGCEMLIAHDGMQGLHLARTESPDLILLDIMLPGLGGMSVWEILQTRPSTREIPVFILSALDQRWMGSRLSRNKSCRFFTKPVDLKILHETIFQLLSQKGGGTNRSTARSPKTDSRFP